MNTFRLILKYFSQLGTGKIVLWCYLMWYVATVSLYFDPEPSIWLNSLGISAIVGAALLLSIKGGPPNNRWQTFRLFMMPFAVSSFSALIKNQGFFLIFAPDVSALAVQVASCILLVAIAVTSKFVIRTGAVGEPHNRTH